MCNQIGWDFVAAETTAGGQAATEWLYARGLCAIVGG